MNKYYVYLHKNPTTNEIFYVGKGCGQRAYVKSRRGKHYSSYVKKYGNPVVEIVKDNLTSNAAIEMERDLIAKIGRKELGVGALVNSTNGGEYGVDGMIHTNESKLKMSKSKIGKPSNAKGKKWNDISRTNRSISMMGSTRGTYKERKDKGKTFDEDAKKRMAAGKLGKKPILQFDVDGLFIKEWPTTIMAERELGICGIRNAIDTNNPIRKCAGFIWKRKNI
jgi:hypothetical protein